jgi:nicotinate-nucleotide--dimethylbenzimidazole phosphoribosyltransferase
MPFQSLHELCSSVAPADLSLSRRAAAHLDGLAKPKGSLGRLEELAVRLFCIAGGKTPLRVDPAIIFTVAGDHGVAAQGVSLFPQSVTGLMVRNFLDGGACINALCKAAGIEQRVVDAGCADGPFPPHPRLTSLRLGNGTADISSGPAMSRELCAKALLAGAGLAAEAADRGCRCVGIGEMGIGNTTTAAALCCAYLGLAPEDAVGAGTGMDRAGVAHKAEVVRKALRVNREALEADDPLAVPAALGGFEIVVMAGIILGAAERALPVMTDGFISAAAFVTAERLCPLAGDYCFFAHLSAEKGHAAALRALARRPLLDLEMRLGEGTGAALAVVLLRAAAAVYNETASLEDVISGCNPVGIGTAGAKRE